MRHKVTLPSSAVLTLLPKKWRICTLPFATFHFCMWKGRDIVLLSGSNPIVLVPALYQQHQILLPKCYVDMPAGSVAKWDKQRGGCLL